MAYEGFCCFKFNDRHQSNEFKYYADQLGSTFSDIGPYVTIYDNPKNELIVTQVQLRYIDSFLTRGRYE
jgi:hypothetical protein